MSAMPRARCLLSIAFLAGVCSGAAAWAGDSGDAAAAPASTVMPSSLPLRRDVAGPVTTGSWAPSALLVAATAAAGAWAVWRRSVRSRPGPRGEGGNIVVQRLSSQALTTQASVHAVRWNGEEFLLGCTAQQVTLLSRRASPDAAGDAP
jgi:hypothetical protein